MGNLFAFLKEKRLIQTVADRSGFNRILVSKVLRGGRAKPLTQDLIFAAAIEVAKEQEGYVVFVEKVKLFDDKIA